MPVPDETTPDLSPVAARLRRTRHYTIAGFVLIHLSVGGASAFVTSLTHDWLPGVVLSCTLLALLWAVVFLQES